MAEVGSGTQKARRRVSAKLVPVGVLVVLALILIVQNTRSSDLRLLFWTVSAPKWIMLVVVLAAGIVIGSAFPWLRPKKKTVR
jgi:uncharacterized integral membrane protein